MSTVQVNPPTTKRRWGRFSLRTFLIFVAVTAIPCGWFAYKLNQAREQRQAVAAFRALGGNVIYDGNVSTNSKHTPEWLIELFGSDLFYNVRCVLLQANKKLNDADLEHLKALPELQELDLRWTKVTDVGLENLRGLSKLQMLSLGGTIGNLMDKDVPEFSTISDDGIKNLEGLSQLQTLQLGKTQITDAALEHVKKLSQLRTLVVDDTAITDLGLKHLKGLSQLHDINLWNTKVTDAGLDDLLTTLPELDIQEPAGLKRNHSPTRIRPP